MELLQRMKVVGSILPDDMRELLLFTHLLGNKNKSDARVPAVARLHDDQSIISFCLFRRYSSVLMLLSYPSSQVLVLEQW